MGGKKFSPPVPRDGTKGGGGTFHVYIYIYKRADKGIYGGPETYRRSRHTQPPNPPPSHCPPWLWASSPSSARPLPPPSSRPFRLPVLLLLPLRRAVRRPPAALRRAFLYVTDITCTHATLIVRRVARRLGIHMDGRRGKRGGCCSFFGL